MSIVVGSGGASGSGKSFLARRIRDQLPQQVVVADADGDHLLDLVVVSTTEDELRFHKGLGTGDFAAPVQIATGGSSHFALVTDVDANAIPDIVAANQDDDALQGDADQVRLMAEKEGLTAHSASVDIRLRPS